MKSIARLGAATALWLAIGSASAVPLSAGAWSTFDFYDDIESAAWVDESLTPLAFDIVLTESTFLKVVDGGLAGDRFEVFANGQSLGLTSQPSNDTGDVSMDLDFDAAYANGGWSRGVFTLEPGSYSITGRTVTFGTGLFAGTGGVTLVPVPEPGTWALMGTGAILVAGALRRARRA
jgi:hypothetical protein